MTDEKETTRRDACRARSLTDAAERALLDERLGGRDERVPRHEVARV